MNRFSRIVRLLSERGPMTSAQIAAELDLDVGGVSDAISRGRKRLKVRRIYVSEWVRPTSDVRSVAVWAAGNREDAKATRVSAKSIAKQREIERARMERETLGRVAALGGNPWRTCLAQI